VRIVLLGPYHPDIGGAQVYNTRLAEEFLRLGHDVTVVSYGWARSRSGERVVSLPTPRVRGLRGISFMGLAAVKLATEFGDHDVVVAHYAKTSGVAAWLARFLGGPPYVPVFHGTDALVKRGGSLVSRACRKAAANVAVSRFLSSLVQERFGVRPEVIGGGVDARAFRSLPSREDAREELGIRGDGPVLGIVGSLVPVRDPELALEVALSARDAVVVVAGGGPLLGRLKSKARELRSEHRVLFLGPVPHDRIPLVFRACDLTIHAPRFEGYGLSALESMAAGTPPLAARVGALPELIEDGVTGFLAERSLEDMSKKLSAALRDAEALERVSKSAREFALSRSWEAVAREFVSLLGEVAP